MRFKHIEKVCLICLLFLFFVGCVSATDNNTDSLIIEDDNPSALGVYVPAEDTKDIVNYNNTDYIVIIYPMNFNNSEDWAVIEDVSGYLVDNLLL